MLAASLLVALLMAGTLIMQVWLILAERDQMRDTRGNIASLESKLNSLRGEQAKLDAVVRRPENAEVLDRSVFLNTLLLRKAISWTKVFSDLETVMPHNVRLISIRLPQITSQNEVQLDMVVGAQTGEPVLQFLMRLENSPMFGAIALSTSSPPSQTDPLYKYRLSVNYAQSF
jgi:type IV pilus assembly protein PilN